MQRILMAVVAAVIAMLVVAGAAVAQGTESNDDDSFIFRVNGDTTIAAGESVNAGLIVNGDVTVDGTVTDTLIVVNGTATINGVVGSELVVVSGDLVLNAGSEVDDVMLVSSNLTQDPAAVVTGEIEEQDNDFSLGRGLAIFSVVWWIGLVILGVVAAIIFAWLGRAQLFGSVETLRSSFVPSLITAIVLFIALPLIAAVIVFTLVGAPLGLSILFALLPVLLLIGWIVLGTWIASYIIKSDSQAAAIGTAALGAVILALISLIPFVAIIVLLAAMLGAGAVVYRSFRRATTRTLPQEA
ncbi:MAG: hypothetical protein AB7V46_12935 [Thermomicrobiales bacterium]